ncbi:tRNA (guanosine(46)-N7)-methyltransferase TrmB [Alkalitalea saponilacus]|uniref:tRNA (guanine-N(7)-)-methyltransferase n=1 Tax=Alkalitalea saponilacus TaxID=889453 RepID=A0A1T5FRT5_9BACT|nr:tRNA (guanosine(46)-N7)-methyltransferase TrmB [Alkalitalea saponilacus]ASB49478.1 tRNA (guanosine(46)-N7)-methyltransferase TrmB [Alkalitalea saponilacus]SKB98895.1 tRNA (guanine-N7-)-methyltransferase [Alkalitalea saponilacus]
MGKNKLQKFEEMDGFPHVIQAEFDEVFQKDYKLKGKWSSDFFGNLNPLVLELGCGKGEYTVGLARRYPQKNFIGVDIKGSRMHAGASASFKEELKNVGFIRTHIEMINSFFASNEVDEIWLTFPDPQMNKTRKRLTSTRFLDLYARFLKPGGQIHLKTDSWFQYSYTKAVCEANNLAVIHDYMDLHNDDAPLELKDIKTYYEERFMAHSVPIKYLCFILPERHQLAEPEIDIPKDIYHNAGRGVKLYHNDEKAPPKLDVR